MPDDDVKPWTIKNVPPEERNAAIAAAQRASQTMGEWLSRAIRSQVKEDAGAQRAPTVMQPPAPPTSPTIPTSELTEILELATRTGRDGKPSRDITRMINKKIKERLNA
jgi:hypothetical protein